jgi:hypothetical protein
MRKVKNMAKKVKWNSENQYYSAKKTNEAYNEMVDEHNALMDRVAKLAGMKAAPTSYHLEMLDEAPAVNENSGTVKAGKKKK